MLNDFLRRSNKSLAALVLGASTLFLQSCGGGGASSETGLQVGALSVLPATGTMYASVPFELTIAGGRGPYTVVSNEQTVLPVNATVTGNRLTVVPNNPGVVDPQTDPNVVPSRAVTLTIRDNAGTQITGSYNVLQNFMTGYSIAINSISRCGSTDAEAVIGACAGFESRIDVRPTSGGLLRAQRQVRFSVLFGPLSYIQNDNVTLASTYTLTTDSNGNGVARFVPDQNALTQLVGIRVTDVQTSAYRDIVFLLFSRPTGPLTATPGTLPVIAGATTAQCGQGQANVIVTGGTPPYRAVTTSPLSVLISPAEITTSGGTLTVFYGGGLPPNCGSGSIVITDAVGSSVTVTANSSAGTTAPTQPLSVSPTSFCFTAAAQTGSSVVLGGNTTKVVNSANPGIATAALSGSTLTITAGATLGTTTVGVSDGANTVNVSVVRAAVCP